MVQNMIPNMNRADLNIADKIKDLSGLKMYYIQLIMQLFDLLNNHKFKKWYPIKISDIKNRLKS